MKRVLILFILAGLGLGASGQKSRVLAVFQMIDQAKYEEAKEAIELAVWNEKTSRWHRTYYAKALLCQTAYEDGYKDKDSKKTGIYPDQLYLAYSSYERALELDKRGRLETSISQKYYLLSNDFRVLGKDHFVKKEYEKSLRAFEHALLLDNSKLVNAGVDTSLVYNAALAAIEGKNWEKAIGYLTGLHDASYAPATSLLLFQALRVNSDTARSEEVLFEAVKRYGYEDQVVVYLVNLLAETGRLDMAVSVLDEAINYRPDHYFFFWSRGLVYSRMEAYDKAIDSFQSALERAPDEAKLYHHMGVIFFNRGIDLSEAALKISSNEEYLKMIAQSDAQFREALEWLEKAYDMDPTDEETISKLSQLYYQLQMKEEEASLKQMRE